MFFSEVRDALINNKYYSYATKGARFIIERLHRKRNKTSVSGLITESMASYEEVLPPPSLPYTSNSA